MWILDISTKGGVTEETKTNINNYLDKTVKKVLNTPSLNWLRATVDKAAWVDKAMEAHGLETIVYRDEHHAEQIHAHSDILKLARSRNILLLDEAKVGSQVKSDIGRLKAAVREISIGTGIKTGFTPGDYVGGEGEQLLFPLLTLAKATRGAITATPKAFADNKMPFVTTTEYSRGYRAAEAASKNREGILRKYVEDQLDEQARARDDQHNKIMMTLADMATATATKDLASKTAMASIRDHLGKKLNTKDYKPGISSEDLEHHLRRGAGEAEASARRIATEVLSEDKMMTGPPPLDAGGQLTSAGPATSPPAPTGLKDEGPSPSYGGHDDYYHRPQQSRHESPHRDGRPQQRSVEAWGDVDSPRSQKRPGARGGTGSRTEGGGGRQLHFTSRKDPSDLGRHFYNKFKDVATNDKEANELSRRTVHAFCINNYSTDAAMNGLLAVLNPGASKNQAQDVIDDISALFRSEYYNHDQPRGPAKRSKH
jgi:hypothetical protein